MTANANEYEVVETPAHTCWDDPMWDGNMTDGCKGCDAAAKHPCRYCGYGHVFTTHNPETHEEGGDKTFPVVFSSEDEENHWMNNTHSYLD